MTLETMIHAETQSEDEINSMIERSQTMYVECRMPLDVHT